MVAKYRIHALGCKVNQYEAQQIRALLDAFAYAPAAEHDAADLAVVNTCAVTSSATRRNRQVIRRLSDGGRTPVIVVGCGVGAEPERLAGIQGVETVISHGTDLLSELRDHLTRREGAVELGTLPTDVDRNEKCMMPGDRRRREQPTSTGWSPSSGPIISGPLTIVKDEGTLLGRIDSFAGHQRAFLKIQDGCDAFCTYCIIPQLRPNLRSKPIEVAAAEARALVSAGHREIILTGIFLGAYGRETAIRKRFQPGRSPLAELVEALAQTEGLERLRLSSLEPGDVDDDLLNVLASEPLCVPHLHLPLQSGSAETLRRMNRQYAREDFLEMIERVRAKLDRPAISTDIIVGFPGETDADFAQTLDVARFAEFVKIHAFPFSPRAKTAAARWQREFVPSAIAKERMAALVDLETETSLRFRSRLVGKTETVIVEECVAPDEDGGGLYRGRSTRYFEIHAESDIDLCPGDLITVRIDEATPRRTHATRITTKPAVANGVIPLPVRSA